MTRTRTTLLTTSFLSLLAAGAAQAQKPSGDALLSAAQSGLSADAMALLKQGAPVNDIDATGETALAWAVMHGDLDLTSALLPVLPLSGFAYHFHDTRGAAIANVRSALGFGVSIFDSAAGGLGGCPFAPGAPGNIATEDLCRALAADGFETGVDIAKVALASQMIRTKLQSGSPD